MAEWTSVPDPNWSDRRLVPPHVIGSIDLSDRALHERLHEKLDEILRILRKMEAA